MFYFTIAELATSSTPALKYWHSELVKAMTAAEVDEKFCTKLMCQYSQSTEIGKLLTDTLSQYIQIQRPDKLEFIIPDHVACSVTQLQMFQRKVRRHHKGWLRLELCHSYLDYVACDDDIEALAGARWVMCHSYLDYVACDD